MFPVKVESEMFNLFLPLSLADIAPPLFVALFDVKVALSNETVCSDGLVDL